MTSNIQNPTIKSETFNGVEKAYEYAVYLLSLHLRTSGELREKLGLKKYSAEIIENVINQLENNRYVDDERFAEIYLDNLKKYKTFGFFGIKKKLMEKRLPQEIIDRVLNEGLNEDEELKIAKRFVSRNVIARSMATKQSLIEERLLYPSQSSGFAMTQKKKLAQKLKSRGFRGRVISRVLFL